jgi:hypothetical protein
MDEEVDVAGVDLMMTLILEAVPAKPFLKQSLSVDRSGWTLSP